jgi:hypothetical protein
MPEAKKIPLRKKFFFILTSILGFLIILEIFLRVIYYQRNSGNPVAIMHTVNKLKWLMNRGSLSDNLDLRNQSNNFMHYRVRPQLSHATNDSIAAEHAAANFAEYQPWLQFTWGTIKGKYVNHEGLIRKTIPDNSDASAQKYFTIYFLGGSTMYGFNVTDEETIAAYFVNAYKQKYPNGKPIKVINYGIPYYYSYQELMLLTDRLYNNEHPDMVIEIDGLNDFLQPYAAYLRHPFFTPRLQKLMNPSRNYYPEGFSYLDIPENDSPENVFNRILKNYFENINHAKLLAKQYDFQLYSVCQPVPFYNYTNRDNDPICDKRDKKQYQSAFPQIEEAAKTDSTIIFLGDMLKNEKGLPFIDMYHYTPSFNKAIAERIMQSIRF